ncbi:hypothetical protein M0804_005223 [Polistes exclamans]|nr:hypothetical protein M0804_005223 [Polistes exclamans]
MRLSESALILANDETIPEEASAHLKPPWKYLLYWRRLSFATLKFRMRSQKLGKSAKYGWLQVSREVSLDTFNLFIGHALPIPSRYFLFKKQKNMKMGVGGGGVGVGLYRS